MTYEPKTAHETFEDWHALPVGSGVEDTPAHKRFEAWHRGEDVATADFEKLHEDDARPEPSAPEVVEVVEEISPEVSDASRRSVI
jgi:hypothetical protein